MKIISHAQQEWSIVNPSDASGGVFLCIGSDKIWFSSSSLEALERITDAHNAALAAEREKQMTAGEFGRACCGVSVIDINPQAVKKWIASEAELVTAEVRKPLVEAIEMCAVNNAPRNWKEILIDALAEVKGK